MGVTCLSHFCMLHPRYAGLMMMRVSHTHDVIGSLVFLYLVVFCCFFCRLVVLLSLVVITVSCLPAKTNYGVF